MEPITATGTAIDVTTEFENYISYLISEVMDNKFPKFLTTKSEGKSVTVDFKKKSSRAKFALIIHVMSKCYAKLKNREAGTIRDLFYENPRLYRNQRQMDTAILDLCKSFKITRASLSLEASAKGLIAGDMKWIYENGLETNIAGFPCGMLIPSNIKEIKEIITDARCIILVEKDAIFQKMLDEQVFANLGSVILITGKGYPDLATRRLLNMLNNKLHLPVFALVDADPHGIEITSVIKWGAKNISGQLVDSHEYVVPDLVWIGLLPSEINSLALSSDSKIPLSEGDKKKLGHLEVRFRQNKQWHNEIQTLASLGVKLELEALANSNGSFLTSVYLKRKLDTYFAINFCF